MLSGHNNSSSIAQPSLSSPTEGGMGVIFFPILFFISFAVTFASLVNFHTNNPLQNTKRWQEWQEKQRIGFYLTRHYTGKWKNLELTSKWIVRHKTQVFELTTQRLARHRTQILKLTSKQLVFSMNRIAYHRMYVIKLTSKWIAHHEIQVIHLTTDRLAYHKLQLYVLTRNQLARSLEQVMCYRIQVLESTSNQFICPVDRLTWHRTQVNESTSNKAMCSVDRLTYHRTQLINLTSNQLICQMPSPCTLTFKVSSIKHWIPIQIPPPFHYPNAQHQIPTRHIPTAQRGNLRPPTD